MDVWDMAENMGIHIHTFNDSYMISTKNDKETQLFKKSIGLPVKIVSKDKFLKKCLKMNQPN